MFELLEWYSRMLLKLQENTYLHISAYSSNHGIFFQNLHHLHWGGRVQHGVWITHLHPAQYRYINKGYTLISKKKKNNSTLFLWNMNIHSLIHFTYFWTKCSQNNSIKISVCTTYTEASHFFYTLPNMTCSFEEINLIKYFPQSLVYTPDCLCLSGHNKSNVLLNMLGRVYLSLL